MLLPLLLSPLFVGVAQDPVAEPRGWDDFPVLVWRQRYRGKELPAGLIEPFGGINVERDDEAEWARELGLSFYVGHGPGRNDLHLDSDEKWQDLFQHWYDSRDEKLLVRDPCLTDPATMARMEATLDRTLAARGGDHGLGISLGDEVGLTPYGNPFDLCRSETCEARWRAYAKTHEWPVESPTTDEVRLALGDDDFSLLGPWLARRRFHQDVVLDVLQRLAERVRENSPGTPVGLLGLGGQTAFGGVSVPRAAKFLDFLECYPVSESVELLHTAGDVRTLGTVFLNEDTAPGTAWQVWNHWLQGSDGIVVWSDKEIEDLDEHRRRLTRAVEKIREIEARLPGLEHWKMGAATIVHDADSIAASWLKDALLDGATWPRRLAGYQEKNGTRERSVDRWLRALRAAQHDPGAVSMADFDGVTSQNSPILILPQMLVVGESDMASFQWHLNRGRVLVIDGEFGWVDRRGRPWKEDLAARLTGKVVRIGPDDPIDVEELEGLKGIGWPRIEKVADGPLRTGSWFLPDRSGSLFAGRDARDERTLMAFLPDLPTPDERAEGLLPWTLNLENLTDLYEVEWVHPASASEIPAGEPAVLLLRPLF